ncbi:MAG: peroxidase family protein [Phycisphaerae bacterium]
MRSAVCAAMVIGLGVARVRADDRTFDGAGNNVANPTWGAAGVPLMRLSPSAYSDGVWTMGGAGRENPRVISNTIVAQSGSIPNGRGLSDWVWQWGQFLDHDFDLVPAASPTEPQYINVPPGDPVFGFPQIPFNRSTYDPSTGTAPGNPRRQTNAITSYLDGSMVYGSDLATANSLRTLSGGRLATTVHATGDLLPQDGLGNFVAGDVRVNEQIGLTSVHTLFMREHNYWADQLSLANPGWNDEQVYQRARKIVGGEIESITVHEWLPALTGAPVAPYGGYDAGVNATVSNEFAAALFRVGHTMLSPQLLRLDNDGNVIPQGNSSLQDSFFRPDKIVNEGGIAPILKGLASQAMQEVDQHIVEDVRSFLFTIPTGGFDLAALNIQRGRDHGLIDYNSVRVAYGLPAVVSFTDITSNPALAAQLAAVFGTVDNIDLWIGALSEDHLPGSSLGPLLTAGILDQFMRARSGDRFWFENDSDLTGILPTLEGTTLADIIRRNSGITSLQPNVFLVPEPATFALLLAGGLTFRRRRGAAR